MEVMRWDATHAENIVRTADNTDYLRSQPLAMFYTFF